RTEKMDEIEDQIVIWPSRDYTASKWRELFRMRPKAILAVWPRLGIPPKHYSYCANSGLVSPVPTFWVTWEDARDLLLEGNAKISVYLRTKRFETTTASLIAEVVGDTHPEEVVIVGGHYDTVPEVTGAMDNASGVGVVLELARLTVERGVRRTVRFAAWGGEEGGLLGSSQYVAELATNPETGCRNSESERIIDSLDNHVFCLNIDTVGMPLGFNTCYVAGPPQAIEWMEQFERAQASGFMVTDGIDISDHLAFTEGGVPSASIVCEGPPLDLIHTTGDRIELIDDQELQHAAKFADSLLTELASSMDTSFLHARVSSQLSDDAKRHVQLIRHRDWTKPTPP
ncbi:MAG: M20/M25/M40 family metallo-hydrolase, partial [Candidatus Bipolaricaulota bacterium]